MLMSALGHKRTLKHVRPMSALPPKAGIAGRQLDVRFVPKDGVGLQLSVPINASSAAATCQRIVDQHHNDRAHDCDDHAIDIQSSYA
jgi:hypothetical protein